jgi:hypothetical protein
MNDVVDLLGREGGADEAREDAGARREPCRKEVTRAPQHHPTRTKISTHDKKEGSDIKLEKNGMNT